MNSLNRYPQYVLTLIRNHIRVQICRYHRFPMVNAWRQYTNVFNWTQFPHTNSWVHLWRVIVSLSLICRHFKKEAIFKEGGLLLIYTKNYCERVNTRVERVLRNVGRNNHTQLEGNGTDCAHAGPKSCGHDHHKTT